MSRGLQLQLACVFAALGGLAMLGTHAALAAFAGATAATTPVHSLALGTPGSVLAATSDGCASIDLAWAAAAGADSYRVQLSADGGPWSDAVAATPNVTSVTLGGVTATEVRFRVYARDARSGWEGATAAQSPSLSC